MDGVVGQSPEEDVRGDAREDAVEADLVPSARRGDAWREREAVGQIGEARWKRDLGRGRPLTKKQSMA